MSLIPSYLTRLIGVNSWEIETQRGLLENPTSRQIRSEETIQQRRRTGPNNMLAALNKCGAELDATLNALCSQVQRAV